ncbi:hypothetical protein STHU_32880 [Allostella humosa]|nr:hypothetical protein STHU_32880 [Stella humosa]
MKQFLDGELYSVAFKEPDEKGYLNRVYVHGSKMDLYRNDELLLSILGATYSRSMVMSIFSSIVSACRDVQFISGIIALGIAATIGYMTIWHNGMQIPDILGNALTIILGFYFGRASARET